VCSLALVFPEGRIFIEHGFCEGIIATKPRGEHGFGYDPIFYLPEYDKTMAELSDQEKNRISHRAMAAQKIKMYLLGT
jgi:XTP/dITP diphosphohydrolase